ncbi:27829_t:CDS:2, partial [Gigaspora margarita]
MKTYLQDLKRFLIGKTGRTYKDSELKRQLNPGSLHCRNGIDLAEACEVWMKKVNDFQGPATWNQKKIKGLTRMGTAEPKEASNASCYQDGIGHGKPYEDWKERDIRLLRQDDNDLSKSKNEEI